MLVMVLNSFEIIILYIKLNWTMQHIHRGPSSKITKIVAMPEEEEAPTGDSNPQDRGDPGR